MASKESLIRDKSNISLGSWREKEKLALDLLRIVGELRFDKSVELVIFRRKIYDARPSEVINDHQFARNYVSQPISVKNSLELSRAIAKIENLAPSKIDLGKLGVEWAKEGDKFDSIDDFIKNKLTGHIGAEDGNIEPRDVVLYGFGRIGRLAARCIIEQTGRGEQLRLKAIVVRPKLKDKKEEARKRAALLRKDTVHGKFRGIISISDDGSEIVVNGNPIKLIFAKGPEAVSYTHLTLPTTPYV